MLSIDGNPVDIATIGVAFGYAVFRALRHAHSRTAEGFVGELSYGLSLFPLLLLSAVAFSSQALTTLAQGNKVLMTVAGIMALVATLRRRFDKPEKRSTF